MPEGISVTQDSFPHVDSLCPDHAEKLEVSDTTQGETTCEHCKHRAHRPVVAVPDPIDTEQSVVLWYEKTTNLPPHPAPRKILAIFSCAPTLVVHLE